MMTADTIDNLTMIEQSAKAEQVLATKNATLAEKDFKIAALTLELAYYRRKVFIGA